MTMLPRRIDPDATDAPVPAALAPLVEMLRSLLPKPVAGGTTLVGGYPAEVIVQVTAEAIDVMEFSVDWVGPHEPVTFGVPVASLLPDADQRAVAAAISEARSRRHARYRACTHCGRVWPPEWMTDANDGSCQECFERAGGVF